MSEKDILPSLLSSLLENRLKDLEKQSELEMKTLSMLEGYSKTIQTNIPIYFAAIDKYIEKKKKEEEEKKKKEADKKNHKRSQSQGNSLKTPQRSMQRNKTEGSLKTKANKDKVLTKNKSVGNMMRSADQMSKTITKSSGKNLKPLNLNTSNAKVDKAKTPAQTAPNKDTKASSKGTRQRNKSESNKKSKSTGKDLKPKANSKETKDDKKRVSKVEDVHKESNKDKDKGNENKNKNDVKENETNVSNTNTLPPPETEKPKEEAPTDNKQDVEENIPVSKEEVNPPKEAEVPVKETPSKEDKPPATVTATAAAPEVIASHNEEKPPVKEIEPEVKKEEIKMKEIPKVNKTKLLSQETIYRKVLQFFNEKEQMPFVFVSRHTLQIYLKDKLPSAKGEVDLCEKVIFLFTFNTFLNSHTKKRSLKRQFRHSQRLVV